MACQRLLAEKPSIEGRILLRTGLSDDHETEHAMSPAGDAFRQLSLCAADGRAVGIVACRRGL